MPREVMQIGRSKENEEMLSKSKFEIFCGRNKSVNDRDVVSRNGGEFKLVLYIRIYGRDEKAAEHTSGQILLAFRYSGAAISDTSRSAAGRADTDARVVFDRARAHARCRPGGQLDRRAADGSGRDARCCARL